MTTSEFVRHLLGLDINLWVEEDRLKCSAPTGGLTNELVQELKARKSTIIELLKEMDRETASDDDVPTVDRDGTLQASFAQRRSWFAQQLDPESVADNEPRALHFSGPLNVEILRRALERVVARHESLRTRLDSVDGEPVQCIDPPESVSMPVIDLSRLTDTELTEAERTSTYKRVATAEAHRPFNLATNFPLRARLVRKTDDSHVLLLTFHHAAYDAQSLLIVLKELRYFYARLSEGGETDDFLPISKTYVDYAAWQHRQGQSGAWGEARAFWKSELQGVAPLDLRPVRPSSRPDSDAIARPNHGKMVSVSLSEATTDALRALAAKEQTTLFTVVLAGLQILLKRRTGQSDFAIATPVAGRPSAAMRSVVGNFINTIVVRSDLSGMPTFRGVTRRVHSRLQRVREHAMFPFEQMVDALRVERRAGRHPLAQVAFAWQETAGGEAARASSAESVADYLQHPQPCGRLTLQLMDDIAVPPNFDLMIQGIDLDDGITLRCQYSTRRFRSKYAEAFASHMQNVFEALAERPGQPTYVHNALPATEQTLVLERWALGDREEGEAEVHGADLIPARVEATARRVPDRVALVDAQSRHLTYAALQRASDHGASRLRRRLNHLRDLRSTSASGASTSDASAPVVGIMTARRPSMVVALLATWKAGAAYVPLDPTYPVARLRLMVTDSGADLICIDETTKSLARDLVPSSTETSPRERSNRLFALDTLKDSGSSDTSFSPAAESSGLAYVIYTSGSTGRPKGVEITHAALANFLRSMLERPGLTESDRLLAVTTLSFDISLFELFGILLCGGRMELADTDEAADGRVLLRRIARTQVTTLQATPATWQMLATADTGAEQMSAANLAWPERILSGGEELPPDLAQRLLQRGDEVWNLYGPTEATVWATVHPVGSKHDDAHRVSIGRPLRGVAAYVLDRGLHPVSPGCRGDLYLGGVQVARGYRGRPRKTAAAFVPNPYGEPGSRLYRTGDQARWSSDGRVHFLGRADRQVKIRGHRIEPAEVETQLRLVSGVRHAAVTAHALSATSPHDMRLVGYVELEPDTATNASALRHALSQNLPAYMVPRTVLVLDAMPLTPNRKVDRKALPPPGPSSERHIDPPETAMEVAIADLWTDLLEVETVGRGDDFFRLGGHSLLAMQVVTRLAATFDAEVPVRALFDAPTLSAFAQEVERIRATSRPKPASIPRVSRSPGSVPATVEQRRLWLHQKRHPSSSAYNLPVVFDLSGPLHIPAITASVEDIVQRHEVLRSTLQQDQDGTLQQYVRDCPDSVCPTVDLTGLSEEIRHCETRRVSRQEALRTFDLSNDLPIRGRLLLDVADEGHVSHARLLLTLHHAAADGWSVERIAGEMKQGYEAACNGSEPPPPPAVQYRDYAVWQQRQIETREDDDRHLQYWRRQLDGVPPLRLPTDRPMGAQPSSASRAVVQVLRGEVGSALRRIRKETGVTPFVVLLTAVQIVLSRYAQQEDFAIATPVAGRDHPDLRDVVGCFVDTLALRADLSERPTARDTLHRVRQVLLDGQMHAEPPFDRVVEILGRQRADGRLPLAHVAVAWQDTTAASGGISLAQMHGEEDGVGLQFGDVSVRLHPPSDIAGKFDLVVQGAPVGDSLGLRVEYRTAYFDRSRIDRMMGHLRNVILGTARKLDSVVSEIPMLSVGERDRLLHEFPGRTGPSSDLGADVEPQHADEFEAVPAQIQAQAAQTPDATAVVDTAGRHVTYAAITDASVRLAHRLRESGIGQGDVVGVLLNRTPNLVAALLAVWNVGAAYCPLDPSYPDDRLAYILDDSEAALLVTDNASITTVDALRGRAQLPPTLYVGCGAGATDPKRGITSEGNARVERVDSTWSLPGSKSDPDALAYLLYTSGSTGRPKGVMIPHRNVSALLKSCLRDLGLGEVGSQGRAEAQPSGEVWSCTHAYAFDFSVWEMWGALATGGRLLLVGDRQRRRAPELAETLVRHGVTMLSQTPSAFGSLVQTKVGRTGGLRGLRTVVFGGEELDVSSLQGWFDIYGSDRPRLINMYGITETTVHVTFEHVRPVDPSKKPVRDPDGETLGLSGPGSRIGTALSHLRVYVLNENMQPVPVGVPGEMYVGGQGLAWGYRNLPRRTAERFVPDPFAKRDRSEGSNHSSPDRRLYRTGDRAQWTSDGILRYLGRIDRQVQVRGYRVEPGEIEGSLMRIDGVEQAVVVARGKGSHRYLVGYWVSAPGADQTDEDIRTELQRQVPPYMVPARLVSLETVPLTPNGKVDLDALSDPATSDTETLEDGPRTQMENVVGEVWKEVLSLSNPQRVDNFFDRGGNSLLAMQVCARLRNVTGVDIPIEAVFEAPSLQELAVRIEDIRSTTDAPVTDDVALRPRPPREGPSPVTLEQLRLWFLQKMRPQSSAYNISRVVHLRGPLDVEALRASLGNVMDRHHPLRTILPQGPGGEPVQRIFPVPAPTIRLVDLSHLPDRQRHSEARRRAERDLRRPFDLEEDRPVRAHLLRIDSDEHVLSLCIHHVAVDGWSMRILIREMARGYASRIRGEDVSPDPTWTQPELPLEYADYAVWQRAQEGGDEKSVQEWKKVIGGTPNLNLSGGRSPDAKPKRRAGTVDISVPVHVVAQLRRLIRREESTLFVAVMAALQAVLARHSGQQDFAIGTPVAGRKHTDVEPLIGLFTRTQVVRADLSDTPSFRELLRRVQQTVLDGRRRGLAPLDRIVEALDIERSLHRHPIFQVFFAFDGVALHRSEARGGEAAKSDGHALRNATTTESNVGFEVLNEVDVDVDPWFFPARHTKFALSLSLRTVAHSSPTRAEKDVFSEDVRERDEEEGEQRSVSLQGHLTYATGIVEAGKAERIARHVERILAAAVEAPDLPVNRLAMMTPDEQRQIEAWSRGPVNGAGNTPIERGSSVPDRLDAVTESAPDRVALVSERHHVTYQTLQNRAEQVARTVRQVVQKRADAAAKPVFGVVLSRTPDIIATLWGIWKAEAAYVPLDPEDPPSQLHRILSDCHAVACFVDDEAAALLADEGKEAPVRLCRLPDVTPRLKKQNKEEGNRSSGVGEKEAAYVLYTSGSTGLPKGVVVSHGALSSYLDAVRSSVSTGPATHWAWIQPVAFDASVTTMYGALTAGATLHILPRETTRHPRRFADVAEQRGFDFLKGTPSHLHALLSESPDALPTNTLVFGGEALRVETLKSLLPNIAPCRIVNQYGPTEAVVGSVVEVIPEGDHVVDHHHDGSVAIGRPIAGAQAWVLDKAGDPVPPGSAGELYLGGDLARGYRGRPRETAQSFVPNPFAETPGQRLFRTRDLVRRTTDGRLIFLGRTDRQVQLAGRRVDLAGVEWTLMGLPKVEQAAICVVREAKDAHRGRLVAYLSGASLPSMEDLRSKLTDQVPSALVPSKLVARASLPRTSNGKINYDALEREARTAFESARSASSATSSNPLTTDTEKRLGSIWEEVFDLDEVRRTSDFFKLGGHSLLAMRVAARIDDEFGVDLPLRTVFESPTLARIADAIDEAMASNSADAGRTSSPIRPSQSSSVDVDTLSDDEVDALLQNLLSNDDE